MQEKGRFVGAGMLPADLPPFPNGYQRGKSLWVYNQANGCYRRHLLLHEGTHAFMDHFLGGLGPPWYAEGMAELLGTHRWHDGQLTLGYVPKDKTETPGWGRVKIIKDKAAAGRGTDARCDHGLWTDRTSTQRALWLVLGNGHVSGCASAMSSGVSAVAGHGPQAGSDRLAPPQLQAEWPDINEEWQLFVMNVDYGYDVGREAILRKSAQPLPPEGATAAVAADRGWQSTGIRLEAGRKYRLEAKGRCQIGKSSGIWWCEPGGITLHYDQSRPLGLLLAPSKTTLNRWPV